MRGIRIVVALLVVIVATIAGADQPASQIPRSLLSTATVGHIATPALCESSGVVASRTQPGVLWTHNDSGNAPVIYAIDQTGTLLDEYPVLAANIDWEDIAIDDTGHLFLADVGNNGGSRNQIAVYRVCEPTIGIQVGQPLVPVTSWTLTFPGAPFDCEAFIVAKGCGWLIDKLYGEPARLWRFQLDGPAIQTLEEVACLPVRSPVTGADLSADGKSLAVIGYLGLNIFQLSGDVSSAASVTPLHLGFLETSIEACCFVPGGVVATSEHRDIYLFTDAMIAGAGGAKP